MLGISQSNTVALWYSTLFSTLFLSSLPGRSALHTMRLLSLLWLCWTQRTTHTAAANALGAAVDVEDGALLVVRPDGHDEHLWSCAFVAEGAKLA